MITKEKAIIDARIAGIFRIERNRSSSCLDEEDFAMASIGTIDTIMVDLETTEGVDDILYQIKTSMESIECADRCRMVSQLIMPSFVREEMIAMCDALDRSVLGLHFDKRLPKGHIKVTIFLYEMSDETLWAEEKLRQESEIYMVVE